MRSFIGVFMTNDHLQEIKRFREQLANIGQTPRIFSSPADAIYFQIRKDIPEGLHIEDYPVQVQIISVAKKSLFMVTPTNQLFLNPIALGQIISSLDALLLLRSQYLRHGIVFIQGLKLFQ